MSQQAISQSRSSLLLLNKQYGLGPFNRSIKATFTDSSTIAKRIPNLIDDYIIKHFSIGSSNISDTEYYFLVGKDRKGNRVLIYDKNSDLDFTNDSIICYPEVNMNVIDTALKVSLVYQGNGSRIFTVNPVFESKNFKYNTTSAQDKFLMISVYEHFKADFIFNSRKYSIYASNRRVSPYFENDNGTLILMHSPDTSIALKIGMPAKIDNLIVEPVFISKYADTLKLNIYDTMQSRNILGTNVGFLFPVIRLTDIKNKQLILPIKDNYNLLDFWGTWCGPCKALTPALKQISDKKNTMLDIISIAYEDDSINVIKYIKAKDMNWYHCIANRNNNNIKIIEMCDLTSYPTFILINPEGIVSGKYIGMDGFEKLKLKLHELGLISN